MSTVTTRPDRQQILQPYRERLAALDGHAESPGVPSRINVGSRSFSVEPWERGVVLGLLKGGGSRIGWTGLLADGLALQFKSLSDLERLARSEEQGGGTLVREELSLDTAFALALMYEIQRAIDRVVVQGEMDVARKLTRFRNKLGHQIGELKAALDPDAIEQADCVAAELIHNATEEGEPDSEKPNGATEPETPPHGALLSLERHLESKGDPPTRRPTSSRIVVRKPKRRRSLVMPLLGVLAVSVGAWLLLVVRPAMTRVVYPVFSLADFAQVPVVDEVLAKPPALYVKVDERAWRALSEQGRNRAVEAVAARIGPAEYTGANFTDSQGRTVARWMKHSGVTVLPHH